MNNYDVVIIGAGPAGIFTALEMIRNGSKKKIAIVEKGRPVEKRSCPKTKTKVCMNCKPYCHITTGFSGAGAFSDGKLSLSYEVGGDLPELIGEDFAQEIIEYTDSIYLEFGADSKVEGIGQEEKVKDIRKRAIQAGLKLVDCPIRHLGTEKAQEIYYSIEKYLIQNGVDIYFGYACKDVVIESGKCIGAIIESAAKHDDLKTLVGKHIVVATGRKGADWLEKLCEEHNILHEPGTVDIGVRVEVRNEIMEDVNNVLYESKLIGYPQPFKNKVRTFCQNPGGFVSQENYDNDLAVVNGHILVQRYGDILSGKRTWQKELTRSNVKPSLSDAIADDITAAMPYRAMINIINFIQAVDHVVPGFAGDETLLYSPELKFYSNRVKMTKDFITNIDGLYCLGDSSGWTRGLMMASVMGVLMGRKLV